MPRYLTLSAPLTSLLISLLTSLFIFSSCGDPVGPRKPAVLMVSPEQLRMPQPMRGEGVAERTFYITNAGQEDLILERVTLDEEDNEQELFLDLGDEWTSESGPTLAGAESIEVKVLWRPIDSLADVASIEVVSNRGSKTIEVITPVPDSAIAVMVEPAGVPTHNGQSVTLEATPSTWAKATVTLISDTGAPITLSEVCLSDAEGQCITPEDDTVRLCREADPTPDSCVPLGTLPELNAMQSYTFSLLFAPTQVRDSISFIQINSDAQNRAQYQIEINTIAREYMIFGLMHQRPTLGQFRVRMPYIALL